MAAVSLAGPFFYLQEIPAAGLAAGLQTVFAKELGSGQTDRVNRQFSQIFFSTLGLLAVLTVLAFSGIRGMAVLFGARGTRLRCGRSPRSTFTGSRLKSSHMCCSAS